MRKHKPKPRVIAADPRYNDPEITRFVNNLMYDGKKSTGFAAFYGAMDIIKSRVSDQSELDVFKKALANVMPNIEVRSRRVGGSTFQIPTEIPAQRRITTGMKWLIKYARTRSGKGISEKLAAEFMAAAKGEGAAVKKKEDTHKMADANKAFAHYRV